MVTVTDEPTRTRGADGDATATPVGRTSLWLRPERPRRGAGPSLSREQIVGAAVALIDEEGLDALSMRRLAARVGVAPMSLYWHVERKDDLIELVADAIFGEMDLPDGPTGDWRADLTRIAVQTRLIFRRHPWLLQTFGQHGHYGPNFLRHAEFSFGSLAQAGVPLRRMIAIVSAVDSYVFGCLLGWNGDGGHERIAPGDAEVAAMAENFRVALRQGDYPVLSSLSGSIEEWVGGEDLAELNFRFGLDALLDGIEARLTTSGTRSGADDPG